MYKSIHTHVHVYIYKSANPARAKKLEVDRGMGHGRSIVNLKKKKFLKGNNLSKEVKYYTPFFFLPNSMG